MRFKLKHGRSLSKMHLPIISHGRLMMASYAGHAQVVDQLLKAGADASICDLSGFIFIHILKGLKKDFKFTGVNLLYLHPYSLAQ